MATITPTITVIEEAYLGGKVRLVTWTPLTSADTATPLDRKYAAWTDRAVQVEGTHGTGSTSLQGSLDGVNFRVLNDPQGNPLTFAAGTVRVEGVLEPVLDIRPVVTGDSTGITVSLLLVSQ